MKITIYTTTACQFSKQEKDYLTSHSLPFEEKNLDTNKDFLTEMMTVGSNFAGTPVTKIEKDDGTSSVLKGFTKEEFDKELGFQTEPKPEAAAEAQPAAPADTPVKPQQTETAPTSQPEPTVAETPVQKPEEAPLNDVLNKLQSTINEAAGTATTQPQPTTPVETPPQPPTQPIMPPVENAPPIPDFPQDTAAAPQVK